MAAINRFLQIPSTVIHPVHVTLTGPHHGIRSLVRLIEDPYYRGNLHYRDNAISPSFDVRESDNVFFLEGEFPGVADKKDIMIERLGSRTLQIRSSVARFDLRAEWSSAWMIPMEKGREEEPAMNDEEEA